MVGLSFAYYCSGHGYGHATRVSAFASHLLGLDHRGPPTVHIISSAPKHVFEDSIARGALYRYADIDPVIIQPLAYRVDRQKSLDVLRDFMRKKDRKVEDEVRWLQDMSIDCVLSDAAFLGCLAANVACLPSVLITNFTFDSVYSFLSTSILDQPPASHLSTSLQPPCSNPNQPKLAPDEPLSEDELAPLVAQIHQGYRCADLLLLLPASIPIPSFFVEPSLPSSNWVDPHSRSFHPEIIEYLTDPDYSVLHPSVPFSSHTIRSRWTEAYQEKTQEKLKPVPRSVRRAPLLVRTPEPVVYTTAGRRQLLTSIGIPSHLQDPDQTKILIVSFGGQVFRKPPSRPPSRRSSTQIGTGVPTRASFTNMFPMSQLPKEPKKVDGASEIFGRNMLDVLDRELAGVKGKGAMGTLKHAGDGAQRSLPLATSSLLLIPGAPPVAKPPPTSPPLTSPPIFTAITIPPTPLGSPGSSSLHKDLSGGFRLPEQQHGALGTEEEFIPRLLPDESWIAIVCGVSKEWGNEDGEELPEGFFVAPKDVYMPDLTALADVLLGKLGYGTVSECVDSCTPFVYVSRPLFIEEHGLRLFLSQSGVGVELPRASYEAGDWAGAVEEAWQKGREEKVRKRMVGEADVVKRRREGRQMASELIDWVKDWKRTTVS